MKSLSLARPHLLILTGIPGSGKTFFAEKFSDTFNAPFINRYYLQNLLDNNIETSNDVAAYMLAEVMKSGQSLLLETDSASRKDRLELARLARTKGYEPLFIWVQTDQETARQRSAKRSRTHASRTLTAEEHERLTRRFTPLTIEPHVVISGKHTYATQAKVILTKLSAPRAQMSRDTNTRQTQSQPPATEPRRRNISIG